MAQQVASIVSGPNGPFRFLLLDLMHSALPPLPCMIVNDRSVKTIIGNSCTELQGLQENRGRRAAVRKEGTVDCRRERVTPVTVETKIERKKLQ